MFSLRQLLSVGALALLATAAPAAATVPSSSTTPADDTAESSVSSYCILSSLAFTNGLTITQSTAAGVAQTGGFVNNHFHYTCSVRSRSTQAMKHRSTND